MSKVNQQRQTKFILVISCIREPVALIIPNVANVFTKLTHVTLQEAFETAAQINEENGI